VIEELRMDVVYQREWRRLDPRALVLKNMNTPEDYDEARKWWGAEKRYEGERAGRTRQAREGRSRVI
jgi:hypothetical protein